MQSKHCESNACVVLLHPTSTTNSRNSGFWILDAHAENPLKVVCRTHPELRVQMQMSQIYRLESPRHKIRRSSCQQMSPESLMGENKGSQCLGSFDHKIAEKPINQQLKQKNLFTWKIFFYEFLRFFHFKNVICVVISNIQCRCHFFFDSFHKSPAMLWGKDVLDASNTKRAFLRLTINENAYLTPCKLGTMKMSELYRKKEKIEILRIKRN